MLILQPASPSDAFSDSFAAVLEEISWLEIELDILANGAVVDKLSMFEAQMKIVSKEMGCDVA